MDKEIQKVWDKLNGFDEVPDWGDMIELEDFQEACINHAFIDYDGDGYYATATGIDRSHLIRPSNIRDGEEAPKWATHVCWFNR